MDAGKPWTGEILETEGFATMKLNSWVDFGEFVREMQGLPDYIWRGQRCENWPLEPSLDRLYVGKNELKKMIASGTPNYFYKQRLERFQYAVRGRRGVNPQALDDENAWWALGQHHGLATPLLDWTKSPFVALFFAFAEVAEGDQTPNRAVYALQKVRAQILAEAKAENENSRRKAELQKRTEPGEQLSGLADLALLKEAKPEVQFISPLSDENPRLVNQAGLFSRAPFGNPIDRWITENHDPDWNSFTLIRILVPDKERDQCLQNLNRMNINHVSLFPDLFGAAQFCNLSAEIPNY